MAFCSGVRILLYMGAKGDMGSDPNCLELSSSDEADDLVCVSMKRSHKVASATDADDDDDDVIVIEKSQCTVSRARKLQKIVEAVNDDDGGGDDDDCCILADPPEAKVVDMVYSELEELVVTGEIGPVACRDFPHARHLCVRFPFGDTSPLDHCEQCHCFVCETLAPCGFWSVHCYASDKEEKWRALRKSYKSPQAGLQHVPVTVPGPPPLPRQRIVSKRPPSSAPTMSDYALGTRGPSLANIHRSRFHAAPGAPKTNNVTAVRPPIRHPNIRQTYRPPPTNLSSSNFRPVGGQANFPSPNGRPGGPTGFPLPNTRPDGPTHGARPVLGGPNLRQVVVEKPRQKKQVSRRVAKSPTGQPSLGAQNSVSVSVPPCNFSYARPPSSCTSPPVVPAAAVVPESAPPAPPQQCPASVTPGTSVQLSYSQQNTNAAGSQQATHIEELEADWDSLYDLLHEP